jgi:hypothetical protein
MMEEVKPKLKPAKVFDINSSRVSDSTLAHFLAGPIPNNLLDVPGIGPSAVEKLKVDNVESPIQLLGIFLTMKAPDMTQTQHCNAMWFYLQELGINSSRSCIVHCIAEKANLLIPGIFCLT